MREPRYTASEWRDITDLRAHWAAFCDCDPLPVEDFIERMEAAGFAELLPVTNDDLSQMFADELGIVVGGMVWHLTEAGRRAVSTEAGKQ